MAASDARLARRSSSSAYWAAAILAALVPMAILAIGRGMLLAGMSALLVLVAILVHRLPRLAGPVFFYDLIRTTRRGRYALARTLYGVVLMALFLLVLDSWLTTLQWTKRPNWSELGKALFIVLALAQIAAVILFTPAYTIGAIIDE